MNVPKKPPLIMRSPHSDEYPDSDGEPMAENTLQWQWIVTIKEGLETAFRDRPDVFVAGDLLWYPVEGDNTTRVAPDALVVFGRPKGHRGSYQQWQEDGIPPQVVFEVLSPGNRAGEMTRKRGFYERFGVEEYYIYDPDDREVEGWIRDGDRFRPVEAMHGWVSPRMNVRFELQDELRLFGPDGNKFSTFQEMADQRDEAEHDRLAAEQERDDAQKQRDDAQKQRDDAQKQRDDADRRRAAAERAREDAQKQRDDADRRRAAAERARDLERAELEAARRRLERMAALLKAAGLDPKMDDPNGPDEIG